MNATGRHSIISSLLSSNPSVSMHQNIIGESINNVLYDKLLKKKVEKDKNIDKV
tara:strand:+ start:119 stop:280 length:162 start_codon:yes stop_codon:yes gene_type:complete